MSRSISCIWYIIYVNYAYILVKLASLNYHCEKIADNFVTNV